MRLSAAALGVLAITCTVAGRDTPQAPVQATPPTDECVCECERNDDAVAACKADLAEMAESLHEARSNVRTRTRVVEASGPPRKCGGDAPKITDVPTAACAPGMVCLDARSQRALAVNLAAYEAYVRKVRACESEP
jgi:hypothetical protein